MCFYKNNYDALLSLMRSMHASYRIFISSLWQQGNLTLQLLIIDLLEEKILMKRLGSAFNSLITLYVRKLSTHLKFLNYKNSTMNIFPSKGKGSHVSFDHTNKTSLTCFYCKKIGPRNNRNMGTYI